VVGDVKSQGIVTVAITTKITDEATAGEYQVPLTIGYTYLASSEQAGTDTIQFNYEQRTETIPITIRIKPEVKTEVLEAVPENLNVGSDGYLNLRIKNTGFEDGKKATVKLIRNGASPLIPVDNSVFIGDFPRNGLLPAGTGFRCPAMLKNRHTRSISLSPTRTGTGMRSLRLLKLLVYPWEERSHSPPEPFR